MPRPIDDFIEQDNASDHEVDDRKSKPIKQKKRRSGSIETLSCVDDSLSLVEDTLFNSETGCQNFLNDSQIDNQSEKINSSPKSNSTKKKKKFKDEDDGCSSEEERWLHAIEAGKLEEVDDELKKIKPKDPKLMTARQRAMLERKSDKDGVVEQLLSLPTGYREKIFTPEMLEEKAKKLQKRKQLADEKRENDKKKTMERLLKKSESKSVKISQKLKGQRKSIPHIVYTNRIDSVTISLPTDISFPLSARRLDYQPKLISCAIDECKRTKKFACAKTGLPLCSFECYRKNLEKIEK